MKIFDRYLLRVFSAVFFGSLAVICFLFIVMSVLDSITRLMAEEGVTIFHIVRFYLLQLPQTIYMASPMAALLSCMITLGLLNQRHELTVLRASGVSLARAAAPLAGASLVIAAGLFVLGETLIPPSNRRFLAAEQRFSKGKEEEKPLWYISAKNRAGERTVVCMEKLLRATGEAEGITVFKLSRDWSLTEEWRGDSAVYIPGRGWLVRKVRLLRFSGHKPPRAESAEEMFLNLRERPDELLKVQREPSEMNLFELREQIRRVKRYGKSSRPYQVEMHARFSIPLAAVILVLVGAGLAIRPVRSGGLFFSILAAVVIGFAYFMVMALMLAFGRGGAVSPWAAAWSADIVFAALGWFSFSRLFK